MVLFTVLYVLIPSLREINQYHLSQPKTQVYISISDYNLY